MLKRPTEADIDPQNPFAGDKLQRQQEIKVLSDLVKSAEQPFVLSVEAPFGFGKTKFIKMWKASLESERHICLYFNAWENDFIDDPLVAFLGEMTKYVEEAFKGLNENHPAQKTWEEVKRIGGGVLRKTLPLAFQIATHGLLNQEAVQKISGPISEEADKIGEFASKLAKERLKRYTEERNGIVAFRRNLEKLASELIAGGGKTRPLVFFVDELDRCRPDFAVVLLERIKHLFNVQGVVFVLAINRGQLSESVKGLYGSGTKTDGYLRRFIDLAYQLQEPSVEQFALSLFDRFSFRELHWPNSEIFIRSFSEFSRAFELSLRDQEQCFLEMNIALRTYPLIRNHPVVLTFLATLRAFKPGIIGDLRSDKINIETVVAWISKIGNENLKIQAEAALRVGFPSEKNSKMIQKIHNWPLGVAIPQGQMEVYKRDQALARAMQAFQEWRPNVTEIVISYLTLSAQFR